MSDKPEFTIRDGAVKATVWRNAGDKGDYFTTSFSRTYKDERSGELRDTNSFSGTDLLKVSTLAQEAYQQSRVLRQEQRIQQMRDQPRERTPRKRDRDSFER